jgi:acyl-CoA synthetase (AMP-forming)/AMP-acid ligase II
MHRWLHGGSLTLSTLSIDHGRRAPAGAAAASLRELITARGCLGPRTAYAGGSQTREVTYAELARQATLWSSALHGRGVGTGHRAGLLASDPLDFATAYLALLAAGVTVVPLDPGVSPDEIARREDVLGVDLLIAADEGAPAGPAPVWRLQGSRLRPPAGSPVGPRRRPVGVAPAVILSSSGTTGTPKLIPLSERQLLHVARQVADHHGLGPEDRGYSPLPLFHINAEVVGLLATLVAGSSLVLDGRFRRTEFWDRVRAHRVTWINAVPAILAILSDTAPPDARTASRVRFARSASAPLPVAVLQRFEERCGVSVLETYGMTEAASQIAANPLPVAARRPGSVGRPVGVSLRVVDGAGEPCPVGAVGSVEIAGPSVVREYLVPGPREERRPARGASGWLTTGDLGALDEDGFLFLTGRADDVINSGGEKVYPREIEELLRHHPAVTEAAVVGQPEPVLGQCPVAYVTADRAVEPAELVRQLLELCEARLSRAKRPRRLVVVDSLPAGPTGKVSRSRLRQVVLEAGGQRVEASAVWSR